MNIVFRAFPGPDDGCVFVEVEDDTGRSINAGQWRKRPDGLVELHLHPDPTTGAMDSETSTHQQPLQVATSMQSVRKESLQTGSVAHLEEQCHTTTGASGQAVAQEAEPIGYVNRDTFASFLAGEADTTTLFRRGYGLRRSVAVYAVHAHPAPSAASVRAEVRADLLQATMSASADRLEEAARIIRDLSDQTATEFRALQTPHASREGRADG